MPTPVGNVRHVLIWAAGAAACLMCQVVQAQIQNPGFEDPIAFNHWSTVGDHQIQTALMGDTPTQGLNQALLATETDGSVNALVTPGTGVSESTLESALDLTTGSLSTLSGSTVLLGSGIDQSVSLVAGDKVSFDWDFLTNQTYNDGTSDSIPPSPNANDFSFFDTVGPGGVRTVVTLANTFYGYVSDPSASGGFTTGLQLTATDNPFISETTYQKYTWTVSVTGTYLIGAGVAHVTANGAPDDGINSALLLDNFQVAAVPEPAGMAGFGALTLGFLWRRRRDDRVR